MIKKKSLFLFVICFCLLCACDSEKNITGKVVEIKIDEEIGVTSFVVRTESNKDIGFFITDETNVFSFADRMIANEFKKGSFNDVIVSIKHKNAGYSLTTKTNKEITAYNAKEIEITGFLTSEIAFLGDGTNVYIWKDHYDFVYKLQNGIELLRIAELVGPNNIYVGGIESFDDLEENAQSNVLKYYKKQGLLYDIQDELEKAYDGYLKKEDASKFDSYFISQDIAPTASNEYIMYFLTSTLLPIDGRNSYEHRIGAAFNRKTGKVISNWDLFSCSPEEAKKRILDIAGVNDQILREEMEIAFKSEYIILFPDILEVSFKQGILPSQENSYLLDLNYDDKLCEILNEWAIPKPME